MQCFHSSALERRIGHSAKRMASGTRRYALWPVPHYLPAGCGLKGLNNSMDWTKVSLLTIGRVSSPLWFYRVAPPPA